MKALDTLKSVVANVAPTLAASLVPGGPLVGLAVKTISQALLGRADGRVDDLANMAASLTPEAMTALRTAELGFQQRIAELEVEDRKDARARDIAYVHAGKDNTRGDVLSYAAVGLLALCILLLFFYGADLTPVVQNLLSSLIGGLVVIVKDVFAFEFGSSRGSKEKTDALAKR